MSNFEYELDRQRREKATREVEQYRLAALARPAKHGRGYHKFVTTLLSLLGSVFRHP